jgi:hypothetical protein
MTTPAMVAIKSISETIYQTCGPNIPITLLTHPKIPYPSLPLKKKKIDLAMTKNWLIRAKNWLYLPIDISGRLVDFF